MSIHHSQGLKRWARGAIGVLVIGAVLSFLPTNGASLADASDLRAIQTAQAKDHATPSASPQFHLPQRQHRKKTVKRQGISLQDYFSRANESYHAKEYERAIADYQRVVRYGIQDATLFYNKANAHMMAGRPGMAILYYDKALALEPRGKDIRHNLKLAEELSQKSSAVELVEGRSRRGIDSSMALWLKILRVLTPTEMTVLFVAAHLTLFGLLFWRRMRYKRRGTTAHTLLSAGALVAAVLTLLAGTLILGDFYVKNRVTIGIITRPGQADVLEAPTLASRTLFRISEGQRVRVTDLEAGGWLKVRVNPELEGWARHNDVGMVDNIQRQ